MEKERGSLRGRAEALAGRERGLSRREEELKEMDIKAQELQGELAKRKEEVCVASFWLLTSMSKNTSEKEGYSACWKVALLLDTPCSLRLLQIRSTEARAAEVKRDAEKTLEAAVAWEKQRMNEEASLQVLGVELVKVVFRGLLD
jgi:hypothetical protein